MILQWQVLGSNQRRRCRRFCRPPPKSFSTRANSAISESVGWNRDQTAHSQPVPNDVTRTAFRLTVTTEATPPHLPAQRTGPRALHRFAALQHRTRPRQRPEQRLHQRGLLVPKPRGLQTELRGSQVTVTSLMHGPVDTTFFARAGMSTTVLGRARKADPNDVARHLSLGKIALWLEPSRWSGETPQLATTRHPYG